MAVAHQDAIGICALCYYDFWKLRWGLHWIHASMFQQCCGTESSLHISIFLLKIHWRKRRRRRKTQEGRKIKVCVMRPAAQSGLSFDQQAQMEKVKETEKGWTVGTWIGGGGFPLSALTSTIWDGEAEMLALSSNPPAEWGTSGVSGYGFDQPKWVAEQEESVTEPCHL